MKRNGDVSDAHLQAVRRRILDVTKDLFVKYGYKKTTIRMIVQHSGILIGSIYYIFRNKEDICRSLMATIISKAITKIDERCAGESAAFRYAAACYIELLEMEAAPIIRDLYKEGYDSGIIFETMVNEHVKMCHHMFDGTPLAASEEEYYERMLLLKGAVRGCIGELYFEKPHDHARSRYALLLMALFLFKLSPEESRAIVERIEARDDLWLEIANELAQQPIDETDDTAKQCIL